MLIVSILVIEYNTSVSYNTIVFFAERGNEDLRYVSLKTKDRVDGTYNSYAVVFGRYNTLTKEQLSGCNVFMYKRKCFVKLVKHPTIIAFPDNTI